MTKLQDYNLDIKQHVLNVSFFFLYIMQCTHIIKGALCN